MKKLALLILAGAVAAQAQTTTVTIGTTPAATNVLTPGINLGGNSEYGPAQLLKSLNQMNNGYTPPPIYQLTYECGTGSTTTSWYTGAIYGANGFPANFWSGGTYTAVSQTGTSVVQGTITASTANNGSTGTTFTLGTPLAAPCTPGGSTTASDYIIVRQRSVPVGTLTAVQQGFPSGVTYSSDVSPASTNTYQSISVPSGTTINNYIDPVFTSWALDPTKTNVTWLNINGSYTLTYKAKCTGSTGSILYSCGRIGSASLVSGTDTLAACSATSGAGWQTFTHTFTPSEAGGATATLQLSLTGTSSGGNVLYQDRDVIEGSTLTGNTTPFRDSVVAALQKLKPGSLRLMTPPSWSSSVACQIAPIGMRCNSGINGVNMTSVANSIGYDDFLQLAYFLKTTPYITLGSYNGPADWVQIINWLNTSGWNAKFTALGLNIYLAPANEPWNPGAQGQQDGGNGLGFGSTMGPIFTAARGAAGYTSNIKLVGQNWFSGSQAYYKGGGGWMSNVMSAAGCTNGTQSSCPDAMEIAPYQLNTLNNITNINQDLTAESSNFYSAACSYLGGCSASSALATQASMQGNFGINATIYEENLSPEGGTATVTQAQMNQISSSVQQAMAVTRDMLLAERDSKIYGPRNLFAFVDQPYNGACCSTQQSSWTGEAYMAAGPGQTFTNVSRPQDILMGLINTAIGNNNQIPTFTQSGQPTQNYTGGQSGTIAANPSVNLVDTFVRYNGSNSFTLIAYNEDTTSHVLDFAGAGAPTGTVTKTVFGGPVNALTDNNVDSLSQNSPAAVVGIPTPTTLSAPTSDTLPAGSVTIYTYTNGPTPTAATPIFSPTAGTYVGSTSVTITTTTAGATIYYTTNGTTPTTSSTVYSGPVSVVTSQTIKAIAVATGYTNSAVGSAAYVITPVAATPSYAPSPGTYTGTQSITITSATAGASIYYTTNGTTPTTSSTLYTAPISIATTTTLKAIATASGYANSSVQSGVYTITEPTAAAPTFTCSPTSTCPASATPFTVALATTTAGASIYYTLDGTTPTSGSTLYTGPISVIYTETIKAIAIATGYLNSAVASQVMTVTQAAAPTFSPIAGTYSSTQSVTLSTTTVGATICYAINTIATAPTAGTCGSGSTTYSTPITVSTTQVVQALSTKAGLTNSSVATATYTIRPTAGTPTFSPAAGTYASYQSVAISNPSSAPLVCANYTGSTITINQASSCPAGSFAYSSPLLIAASTTIYAVAGGVGFNDSALGSAAYTINGAATPPSFSPAAGTYIGTQTVTLSDATSGCGSYIVWNLTGASSGGNLTGTTAGTSVVVSSSETVYAQVQSCPGYTNSSISAAAYLITTRLTAPTFSPPSGIYSSAVGVNITGPTGASVCYGINVVPTATTPGTCDSGFGPPGGPIPISSTSTLNSISTRAGYVNSNVTTGLYTILPPAQSPTFSPVAGSYPFTQTVTITNPSGTPLTCYNFVGSIIINQASSCPTGSTTYTAPISVAANQTIYAVAGGTGYIDSPQVASAYVLGTQAVTPTFSVAAGTYAMAQTVNLSTTTSGCGPYIVWNTTGAQSGGSLTGTTTGTSVTVSSSETIYSQVQGCSSFTNSAIGSAAYVISSSVTQANTPTFSPAGGSYSSVQSVTINNPSTAPLLCYNTTGTPVINQATSCPAGSNVYTSPVSVATSETLYAVAGGTGNQVTMVQYTANSGFEIVSGNPEISGSLSSPCTAGDTVIVGLFLQTAPTTAPVLTNAYISMTFTLISSKLSGGSGLYIYAVTNCPNANVLFTGSYSGTATNGAVSVMEFQGLVTPFVLDASSLAAGTGTTLSSGSATPSQNEFILSVIGQNSIASVPAISTGGFTLTSAGPGETPPGISQVSFIQVAQQWGIGGQSYNASWSNLTSGATSITALLAIKASGSGANPLPVLGQYLAGPGSGLAVVKHPTPNIVQQGTTAGGGSGAFALSNPVTSGNTGVIFVAEANAIITPTISDTLGNTCTQAGSQTTFYGLYAFVCPISIAGTDTFTVNVGSTYTFSATFTEYSGVVASGSLDAVASMSTANTMVPVTGASVTTTATDLIVSGIISYGSDTPFYLSGFNPSNPTNVYTPSYPSITTSFITEDVVAPAGTYAPSIYYPYTEFGSTVSFSPAISQLTIALKTTGVANNYYGTTAQGTLSYRDSIPAAASYTITIPTAATPTFSPAGGTYTSTQTVSVSTTTPSPSIFCTTDGSTPTTSSPVYHSPFSVAVTTTIKCIATATGYLQSLVGSSTYTINTPTLSSPTFTPGTGTYVGTQTVTLTGPSGAVICYAVGAVPTAPTAGTCGIGSVTYGSPFTVASSQTVNAISTQVGFVNSATSSATYTITAPTAATPTFSPASGSYVAPQSVSISSTTAGSTIYYTRDGSTPTTASPVYSAPFTVSSTTTVNAIAVASGLANSPVGSATYTFSLPAASAPTFSPTPGNYSAPPTVSISSSTTGSSIYYCVASPPATCLASTGSILYTVPLTLTSSEYFSAIATASGYNQSSATSAQYNLTGPVNLLINKILFNLTVLE